MQACPDVVVGAVAVMVCVGLLDDDEVYPNPVEDPSFCQFPTQAL
jgi:hypothetical protein